MMSPTNLKSLDILGCRVDNVTWQDVDSFCLESLEGTAPKQIVTINGEFILEAQKNPLFKQTINAADLVIPDSTNLVWVSRAKGAPLQELTPGSDLIWRLADIAVRNGYSLFLLGARAGIANQAAKVLTARYPDLKIAGTSAANPDDGEALETIVRSRPDIVFVAYGAPVQEIWIAKNKAATKAKILVGVGGAFDMIAGRLPRAPKPMRLLHLEWLWRLILQPSRFGRVWNALVVFPIKAVTSRH